jgi:hypothetical protein
VSERHILHLVVHDYKPGIKALAAQMEIAESTLYSMANPNAATHGWTFERWKQVQHLTNDRRPLHLVCKEFGGVFVETAVYHGVADDALLEQMAKLGKEFGDVCQSLTQAIADGRVTSKEVEDFNQQLYEMQQAGSALGERLGAMVDQTKK